jgi:hypothetical protein
MQGSFIMQTLDQETAQQLAQELVEKTQRIKAIKSEIDLLKLEIYDAAQGGIQCAGGRVVFVEQGTNMQLDRELLKTQLVHQFNLTDQDATSLIDSCKTEKENAAYISVYLD